MTKRLSPCEIDATGLADGTYGLHVVGGRVVDLQPASSGGSSGGGAEGTRYWFRDTADVAVNPMPTGDTLIPGMTLTIPANPNEATAFVSFMVNWSNAHTNRINLYLDGVTIYPTMAGYNAGSGSGISFTSFMANVPIKLAAATTNHVLDVRWNAVDSTAGVTIYDRAFSADVYPYAMGSATVGNLPI